MKKGKKEKVVSKPKYIWAKNDQHAPLDFKVGTTVKFARGMANHTGKILKRNTRKDGRFSYEIKEKSGKVYHIFQGWIKT